tara:strand:+ start:46056 stop:46646 length:591 start_codon:yes stop_codon:yes gene_type:complete
MTNNIDFKELWNKQPIAVPDTKALIEKANAFKRKTRFKLITANVLLLLTSVGMGLVWYYFQPAFITTKIGIIVCILSMMIYIAFLNVMSPSLSDASVDMDAKTGLKQLLELKEKQRFQQTVLLNGYFIFLSVGIGMYMYEYAVRMPFVWAAFTYGIVMVWVGVNSFYFRPKMLEKQQAQLNQLIAKFKEIGTQLKD